MDINQLTSLNKSTSYLVYYHGSAILFKEVWYLCCMVLELRLHICVMSFPSSAILLEEVWYANCMELLH
jgi:hypothetical protein